ncbi:MAG: RluA family pseudouridine synthase [Balneolaceae bacterium]|nr:RluA family pseudouridine synthase [Balneolaceae bacterium]
MKSTNTHPDIPIVFEDQHLLIIVKPHDVLSQEDHTGDPDVFSLCKEYLNKNSRSSYLGLLHRLDRPVGGLMMLAKTPRAASKISQQMRDRLVQKTYYAIVEGKPPANGVLTHHLLKNKQTNIVEIVPENNKKGKRAMLSFAKQKEANGLALLSIHLQTGRPHQIRVQLATEGYPVWGDYKYGQNQPDGRTMALRAVELVFNHPATKKEMRFELDLPPYEPWKTFIEL